MSTLPAGGTLFYFIPIHPLHGKLKGRKIVFPAFLGPINDSHSPNWEGSKDMGRPDPKYRYSEWNRSFSVTFKTAAYSEEINVVKMKELLNSLVSLTYPVYDKGNGYNGMFVQMVIGEIFNKVGKFDNVDVNPHENSPWIDGIPVVHEVSLQFTVIGEKRPEWRIDSTHSPYGGHYRDATTVDPLPSNPPSPVKMNNPPPPITPVT